MFIMTSDAKECAFSKANEAEVVKNFRVESIKDAYKRRIKRTRTKLLTSLCKSRGHSNL